MSQQQLEVIIILSRQGCHLCRVLLKMTRRIQAEVPFRLTTRVIDQDPTLLGQYGERVPVVLINDIERFNGRVTERELRRAIKWARWTRPVSRILSRIGLWPIRG